MDTQSTGGICLSCRNGYYLKENSCLKGTVSNCLKYPDENGNYCLECDIGFGLLKKTYRDYCMPIKKSLSCSSGIFHNSVQYGGFFECTTCDIYDEFLTYDISAISSRTQCMSYTKI